MGSILRWIGSEVIGDVVRRIASREDERAQRLKRGARHVAAAIISGATALLAREGVEVAASPEVATALTDFLYAGMVAGYAVGEQALKGVWARWFGEPQILP